LLTYTENRLSKLLASVLRGIAYPTYMLIVMSKSLGSTILTFAVKTVATRTIRQVSDEFLVRRSLSE